MKKNANMKKIVKTKHTPRKEEYAYDEEDYEEEEDDEDWTYEEEAYDEY